MVYCDTPSLFNRFFFFIKNFPYKVNKWKHQILFKTKKKNTKLINYWKLRQIK